MSGAEFTIIKQVAKHLNFRISTTLQPGPYIRRKTSIEVKRGRADIGGGGFSAAYGYVKNKKAVFTVPLGFQANIIISARPTRGFTSYSMLKALDVYTWVNIVICIFACSGILYISLWINDMVPPVNKKPVINDCIFISVQIALWDSLTIKPKYLSLIINVGIYMTVMSLLMNVFGGQLASVISKPEFDYQPVHSLNHLINKTNLTIYWDLSMGRITQIEGDDTRLGFLLASGRIHSGKHIKRCLEDIQKYHRQYAMFFRRDDALVKIAEYDHMDMYGRHNFTLSRETQGESMRTHFH